MRYKSLLIGAAILALTAVSGVAQAQDDVRLRLNWMWYGSHAPFALGEDRHFYKDDGINLHIRSGNGSDSAVRLVANGDSDFAYASCASMINLAAGGAKVVSVGVIDATGTEAIIVRPDTGIKKITDLKGKTVLTTANAGVNTFFPLVMQTAGMSQSDIHLVNVPEGALVSAYLQGSGGAVGMLGGLDDKPAQIEANGGKPPVTFPYNDYGVNEVGYCIVARTQMVKENPDLVRRFMDATVKSFAAALKNPDAAINSMADIVGGTMNEAASKKQARQVLDVTLGILYSPKNKEKRLGYNVPEDWASMLDLMKKYNGLKTDLPATAFYTNDFVPKM